MRLRVLDYKTHRSWGDDDDDFNYAPRRPLGSHAAAQSIYLYLANLTSEAAPRKPIR